MFFSKKRHYEKKRDAAVNGVISIFGDNLRAAGLDSKRVKPMKGDKAIIGSLYGFCLRAAYIYDESLDGMEVFMIVYSSIFNVIDEQEMGKIAQYVLFDDEVNKKGEETFNYLLHIADSGLSQQEAMLFMKGDMEKYNGIPQLRDYIR